MVTGFIVLSHQSRWHRVNLQLTPSHRFFLCGGVFFYKERKEDEKDFSSRYPDPDFGLYADPGQP